MNINFNPIRTIPAINKTFTRNIAFRAAQSQDTFERTTKPAQISDNKAVQWLEENDYIKNNLLSVFSNPDNKIGCGFTHTGYKIPENDEFILRVSNTRIPSEPFADYEIKDTEDKNLKVNIGQPVAEIILKDNNGERMSEVEVLKRQNGEPLGVKPYSTIYDEYGNINAGEVPFEDISRKETFEKSLHDVAQLPVEAYEKFIDDINSAAESGYRFDFLNSNNILVDKENNSLNLIDMENRGVKNSKVDAASVLYALTNAEYFGTYMSDADSAPMPQEKKNQVFGDTLKIITNYTDAMKNKGIKFDRQNHSHEAQQLILGLPFSFFCQTMDYNEKWNKLEQTGLA